MTSAPVEVVDTVESGADTEALAALVRHEAGADARGVLSEQHVPRGLGGRRSRLPR